MMKKLRRLWRMVTGRPSHADEWRWLMAPVIDLDDFEVELEKPIRAREEEIVRW